MRKFSKFLLVIFIISAVGCSLRKPDLVIMCKDNKTSVEQVQTAIKQGADVNARSDDGVTVLMYVAEHIESPEMVAELVKAGADINALNRDLSALQLAAMHSRSPEVITALADAGADVNARTKDGRTVLMLAAKNNPNPKIIMALLKAGADPTIKDSKGLSTFEHAKGNKGLADTDAYWKLNDALFK